MKDSQNPGPQAGGRAPATGGTRKAWVTPRIISREPMEVVAAACTGFNSKASEPACGLLGGTIRS